MAETELWRFGSEVLGYDAATGAAIDGFSPPGFSVEQWRVATAAPRTYGFHATLKAPFRLNASGEEDLRAALAEFSRVRTSIPVGLMGVTAVGAGHTGGGFVALTPRRTPVELTDLEHDIVTGFDSFRLPMRPEERAKRRPDSLSDRQRRYLDTYGYPFVLDEFRFHMTLTGALDDAPSVADRLADIAAERLGGIMLTIDGLALFRQDAPDMPFRIVSRAPFSGGP